MSGIAGLIDHTLLKPEATEADIRRICAEALQYKFASVCVNPYWVPVVAKELAGSEVKVCSVVGFPLGANRMHVKTVEAHDAIESGAREIDMVINIGELRGGHHELVRSEIELMAHLAHAGGAMIKVILETALLTDEQKAAACEIAKEVGADFVKTSTGFGPGGATVHDVELMRRTVGPDMGVKASGGIRTLEDLQAMVAAGANRIGTSSGVKIVEAARGHSA
ncbi:MAG TPA: deoxyribose-phosphate aldolase [Bryobacteraceae bacterium]|nr:deoxyribose-phosphate aldolase [Bryobacteraceae bacterium]